MTNTESYDFDHTLQPGRQFMRAVSGYGNSHDGVAFTWPLSTHRDYDGPDYEDLTCDESGVYNFEGNAAFVEGKISYSCRASFEPSLVQYYTVFGFGMFEGLNPDGSYIGSYGGEAYNTHDFDDGSYAMLMSEG